VCKGLGATRCTTYRRAPKSHAALRTHPARPAVRAQQARVTCPSYPSFHVSWPFSGPHGPHAAAGRERPHRTRARTFPSRSARPGRVRRGHGRTRPPGPSRWTRRDGTEGTTPFRRPRDRSAVEWRGLRCAGGFPFRAVRASLGGAAKGDDDSVTAPVATACGRQVHRHGHMGRQAPPFPRDLTFCRGPGGRGRADRYMAWRYVSCLHGGQGPVAWTLSRRTTAGVADLVANLDALFS
jgi:hypothetical protein